ncbi:unnamed protein product [Urochloa decumbens]|uniref:Mre11 DNA-binding domain-containing protein n=1 Tax=Urochloa decumbens TaxID=240449 RepID=A0ABC9BM49_9POAL
MLSREEERASILRILVATDCHLGYLEKDEVRRFDSFETFEEICSLAEKNKVDFLLLGGDLFHESKPSNSTLVKTIEILRRYCMNDRPVQFQEPHAVKWVQPETGDGTPAYDDWFNILVIHQNRTKGSPRNGISELLLPRFLDLVIWGHEHECLIDPKEVPGMGFHVTQPGSSIAISLIDAEAKPKHVLLMEIKGTQYRPTKIPLQSVRPFEYAEVVLEDQVDVDPSDEATIHAHLHQINKLTTALEDSTDIDEQQILSCVLDQNTQASEKETIGKASRTGLHNLQSDTLSVFEEPRALGLDDEPIESSDVEESGGSSQQAGRKRRAAPAAVAAAGGRRKTDLASFQRAPAKEEDADAAKKRRAPVAAGRYGAVIRRR